MANINIIIAKVINVAINIISNNNFIINNMIATKIMYIISNVAIRIITIYMIIAKVANVPINMNIDNIVATLSSQEDQPNQGHDHAIILINMITAKICSIMVNCIIVVKIIIAVIAAKVIDIIIIKAIVINFITSNMIIASIANITIYYNSCNHDY